MLFSFSWARILLDRNTHVPKRRACNFLLPQDKSLSIFLNFSLGGSEATIVIANQIRARCGVPHEYILCWQYRASCYVQMTKTNGLKRTELFGG